MRIRWAICVLLLLTSGCSGAIRPLQPFSGSLTDSGFFLRMMQYLTDQLQLDAQRAIQLKDLDLGFAGDGTLQSAWIELRGVRPDGVGRQGRIRLTAGRWSSEELPLHGYDDEFAPAQDVFSGLNGADWPAVIAALGRPSGIAVRTLASDKCEVVALALDPNALRPTVSETTAQVKLAACSSRPAAPHGAG